jgi:uncharacterized 2Fe-2S/4Fe-4S cluster protein (DUF4445 family)
MPIITFQPSGLRIEIEPGQTLLDAAGKLAIVTEHTMEAPCGGRGACGNCRIQILSGSPSPATEAEKRLLAPDQLEAGYRLACQVCPQESLEIEIPPESLAQHPELQIQGWEYEVTPDPPVKRYLVHLDRSRSNPSESTWKQIETSLLAENGLTHLSVPPALIRNLAPLPVPGPVVLTMTGPEVTRVTVGPAGQAPLGLAVDLGTTKLAGFLVNLDNGQTLAADGLINPQIRYGEDVITRLAMAMNGPESIGTLSTALRQGINQLSGQLSQRLGVAVRDIEHIVLTGNTAVIHLLLEWPVNQLGLAPYLPACSSPVELKADELKLAAAPGAHVYIMPAIAGFVGGDHTAMILASRIHEAPGNVLGLDIGTNTEIVLAQNGQMMSCSCASGPAFEGAHIHQGMRAVDGAVCQVEWAGPQGLSFRTVRDKPPLGWCGSGMVDGVAELLKNALLDRNGRLASDHPAYRRQGWAGAPEFVIIPGRDTASGQDLVISQRDISSIQLAKAAIASGWQLLLAEAGLEASQVDRIVVAGAFGSHLRLESAVTLGLLPNLPLERFVQVGNAAGSGARLALLSMAQRRQGEEIARRVRYLELGGRREFSSVFTSNLRFPVAAQVG